MSAKTIYQLPLVASVDITKDTVVPISDFNEVGNLRSLSKISLGDLCRVICEEVTKHGGITMEEMPSGKIKFTRGV